MTISALPTAPNRNMTPEAFVAAADAWVAAMSTFASQVNADLNLILNLSGLLATSTTSVAIGTGSKSFTVETSKAYLAGQSVRVYSTASPANYMLGTVTSYDAGTGALVVNVTSVGGGGTLAAWTVVLAASGEWLGNATSATNQSGGTVDAATVAGSAVRGAASGVGNGAYGTSVDGYGVRGDSGNASGVYGQSTNYVGVYGHSVSNHGMVASGDVASPAKSAFRIIPQDADPTGPNEIGDIYVTTAGVLKICTVAGSPGTWVSVGAQT